MQLLRHYNKPPPPYPRNNSTSTPDLSAHRNTGVSASTPDLHHGYSVAPGQRRGAHLHPIVAEDGRYDLLQEHQEMDEFEPTVIRGVCTSVEALHRTPMVSLKLVGCVPIFMNFVIPLVKFVLLNHTYFV